VLLHDLLSAFEQDVRHTDSRTPLCSLDELLAYCRLSANPVGRLLLHLYGVNDTRSLQRSDQICSALQLINFWQDLSVDLPRQRHYLPSDLLARHGLDHDDFHASSPRQDETRPSRPGRRPWPNCAATPAASWNRAPHWPMRLPGRAGWELRLVVQGGLRVLDRIDRSATAAGGTARRWAEPTSPCFSGAACGCDPAARDLSNDLSDTRHANPSARYLLPSAARRALCLPAGWGAGRSGGGGPAGQQHPGFSQQDSVEAARLDASQVFPVRDAPARVRARNVSRLSAEVAGTLQQWTADVGASVKRGQVLARIDPRDQELGLQRARAALDASQARLRWHRPSCSAPGT
jgi:hypothetical protein